MGTVVVIAALAAGGYYWYTHIRPKPPAPAPPAPAPAPPNPAPPAPGGGGGAPQPPGAAALGKLQSFNANWNQVNGFVQITNGKWVNNATVAVQSATLECDQYDSGGNLLDEMKTTLNGPVQPSGTATYNPFNMGAVAANLSKVTCEITYAKAVGS